MLSEEKMREIISHYLVDDDGWFVSAEVAHYYRSHDGPRWRYWVNRLLGRRCWCGRVANP
jgi:hypothetical protein